MPFTLYTSNRLEILSQQLATVLRQPVGETLEPEVVVVQSRGMERWISLELARHLGVSANVLFPFPNAFVQDVARRVLRETATPGSSAGGAQPDTEVDPSIFEPRILTWRIVKMLPDLLSRPAFAQLRAYLQEPGRDLKRLQLASRIADLFDQYLLYRPELIFAWERGKENHWQAQLWREIARGAETLHRAALGKRLVDALKTATPPDLPRRINVFGISSLPEFHLAVFDALGRHVQVNFFLMNPCQEYWGDILSKKDTRRAARGQLSMDFSESYLQEGNPLLSSFAELGRDFFELVEGFDYQQVTAFLEPEETSLLGCVQADILHLRNRAKDGQTKQEIPAEDRSIQIHACHSARREIEVLYDHLLHLFQTRGELKPGDILVMMPDVEPYVPFIQAVFDLPPDDPRRIPYSIADRSYGRENELIETFFAILNLPNSRFIPAAVLAILESPAVRQKFALSEQDLDLIREWVKKTRVRWGRDAQDRQRLGLPAFEQNTWRAALRRLLLGYALPSPEGELFAGSILPFNEVEGAQAETLGNLAEFIERLFQAVSAFEEPRPLSGWHRLLSSVLENLLDVNTQTVTQVQVLQRAFAEMEEIVHLSGFDEPIGLPVVKHHLQSKLSREGHGFGFLTGGVTFCSMLPMRSIPARVVCLLGMNNDAYPRSNPQLGFDLIAQHPRRGDRSRRKDDRYLFLEAILSARELLHISYVGQSIKDNSRIPPSVVVSELLDYLEGNFKPTEGDLKTQLVTEHRLQAFSPDYFDGGDKLFSYSRENLEAAKRLVLAQKVPPAFVSAAGLPEPDPDFRTVHLDDLYRFFRNPTRYLFNRRLGIYLPEDTDILEEKETFTLAGLEQYKLAEQLLERRLAGEDTEDLRKAADSAGRLPYGHIGRYEFDNLNTKIDHFVRKTGTLVGARQLPPLEIDLALGDFRLVGKIENRTEQGLLFYRYARVQAKDHLRAWLYHLTLNLLNPDDCSPETRLAGLKQPKEGTWAGWRFSPVEQSHEILQQLLEIYWTGLRFLVRFFPRSALKYVQAVRSGQPETQAANNAQKVWSGNTATAGRGERDDPYFERCFGAEDAPLNDEFKTLARTVFEPLLAQEEELQT